MLRFIYLLPVFLFPIIVLAESFYLEGTWISDREQTMLRNKKYLALSGDDKEKVGQMFGHIKWAFADESFTVISEKSKYSAKYTYSMPFSVLKKFEGGIEILVSESDDLTRMHITKTENGFCAKMSYKRKGSDTWDHNENIECFKPFNT